MPIFYLLSLLTLLLTPCQGGVRPHLKKLEHKQPQRGPIKNIDFIYLINLNERSERLQQSREQLEPYGIYPERFPAIYGWRLPKHVLDAIGLVFLPKMDLKLAVLTSELMIRCARQECKVTPIPLKELYGQTIFSPWLSMGGIGCTLSHLSVLQDAYDSGYGTIWVLEDDIFVNENPQQLTALIEKLDNLVGPDGWDVLYTDSCPKTDKAKEPLEQHLPWMWRPDLSLTSAVQEFREVGEDFIKIGGRIGTHSLIIRRSGMKKILEFYTQHSIYVPYDREIALVPGIRLFMPKQSIVSANPGISDTKYWIY